MVNEGLVWLVASVVVGGAFLVFGAATAIVFYRRNRTHESRTEAYLQKVKAIEEAQRAESQRKRRKKRGGTRGTTASAPPSPSAAAIPVSLSGPYHYYTDPTKYTYDSFFTATAGGKHGLSPSPALSTVSSSPSEIATTEAGDSTFYTKNLREDPADKRGGLPSVLSVQF
ncbi:transmembrane protein [Cystoisospora suis]|uniref:Transmembrane protein n=1 Tax=Cystoisospora suis TaxID=483139 RepID=A0A2C6K987_9APIC|nr:transmembrane protein [Cystoisospora suis]